MSDEPEHLGGYPAEGLATAEAGLFEAWEALEKFHADLVVVGGLAVYHHTKDAYDVLVAVSSYSQGAEAAVDAFQREKTADNPAMGTAIEILREHFTSPDAEGPAAACRFRFGKTNQGESGLRLRADLVTISQALLGE